MKLRAAQPGFAAAAAFWIKPAIQADERTAGTPEDETRALEEAAKRVKAGFENAAGTSAEIIQAETDMLFDDAFLGEIKRRVLHGEDALHAVRQVTRELADRFDKSESGYIRGRAEDLRGTGKKLCEALLGRETEYPSVPFIMAGEELSPIDITSAPEGLLAGIVSRYGSASSHASVMAGNRGIPYLYGEALDEKCVRDGEMLILNGEDGTAVASPDSETLRTALERARAEREKAAAAPADGAECPVKILCNIGGTEELDQVLRCGADGIGLVRTEFLFLKRDTAPNEEEQYRIYREIAEKMKGKEAVIRTADIGSDKTVKWLSQPEEKNPQLGSRGLRLSLQHPDVFRVQLRALLRAAVHGELKIMFPMITAERELDEIEKQLSLAEEELKQAGQTYRVPVWGIMVETPAAALIAEKLAARAGFFSVGTNDLTQYTLALDREAKGLDAYYAPCHDAVFALIGAAAAAGHKKGIPTTVCGELAGNPDAVERLIALGVDELSVSPGKAERVRALACRAAKAGIKKEDAKTNAVRESIGAPADGRTVKQEDIPDDAFAGGVLGKCMGILPENGNVYAPVSGRIASLSPDGHAVTFESDDGRKLLVHTGIDTVNMNGEGFRPLVKTGDRVKKGEKVLEFDRQLVRSRGFSDMVITVILKE